jgi:hypothetical protein
MRTRTILPAATLLGGLALAHVSVHAEESQPTDPHGWIGTETRFGDFEFKNGYSWVDSFRRGPTKPVVYSTFKLSSFSGGTSPLC